MEIPMSDIATKKCRICKKVKNITEFGIRGQYRDGLDTRCKSCCNDYHRKWRRDKAKHYKAFYENRRALLQFAKQPPWVHFYQDEMVAFFQRCPSGMAVDHIVPLKGNGVCGLHIPWNLKYSIPVENQRKGDAYSHDQVYAPNPWYRELGDKNAQ